MIGNIIGKVVSKVVAAVPKMVNAVKRAVNKVSTAIRKVVSAVPKVVNAARDKIATKVEKVKKQLYDTAKEKGPQLLEKVMDIGNKNQRILDNIKQAWENTGLNRGTVTIGAILFDGRVPFKMFDFVLKSRRAIVEEYPFLNRNLDLVKDKYKRLQEVGTKVKHSIGNYLYELNIPFVSEYASVVYDVRRGSESNIVTILGSFGKGIADGVIGTIDGIGSVITDPIGTLEGVNTILAYPEIVIPVIGKEIKKGWDDKIVNGSAEDRANIVGYITFEVGAYLITKPAKLGKVADNVGDAGRLADNVGDVGRLADNVGDAGRLVDNVGDVGRLADNVGDVGRLVDNVGDAGRLVDNAGDVGRLADNVGDVGKIPDMARTADKLEDWYDLTKNSIMKSDSGGSGVRISGAVDEKAIGKVADSTGEARKVGVVDDVVEGANKTPITTKKVANSSDEMADVVNNANKTIEKVSYGDQYTKGKNGRKELKPNVEYTSQGGHKYTTDDMGRIDSVEGTLTKNKVKRNEYDQKIVGREDRLLTDDGGHLIASVFEGSGDLDNLVPMNSTLNRGDWKAMENSWSRALSGDPPKAVQVKIEPIYNGTSQRPVSFDVQYKMGNDEWILQTFNN